MQDTLEELIWENRRLFRALAAAADAALAPIGLEARDRAFLEFLAQETTPVSLSHLARKYAVSRQHLHQSLGRLPNPKWVEKTPDPDDARSILVRLTAEGRAKWKEIRVIDKAVLRRLARQVDPSRIERASETLRKIREVLEADA